MNKLFTYIYGTEGNYRTDGWKVFCEQEKHPFACGSEMTQAPVVLCEGEIPPWLGDYMERGGWAIISGAEPGKLPFDTDCRGEAVIENALLCNEGLPARIASSLYVFKGDGEGLIALHEKRIIKEGLHPDEYPAFLLRLFGKGGCWYTGIAISGLIGMQGDILRNIDHFSEVTERITSVDKHLIFACMRHYMKNVWRKAGYPYVRLGYYPKGYKSMFCFRVDGDGIYGNIGRLADAAKKENIPVSFFVNRELCETDADEIAAVQDSLCIGNHGVVHNLQEDYESNKRNIEDCERWMADLGIRSGEGFVAPRGMWNFDLSDALKDLGFTYTSDFGYCVYDLPFYPYDRGKRRGVKQIPVSPFSCERCSVQFREEGKGEVTSAFVSSYFTKLMDLQYRMGMPSILYSHPEVFGSICEEVFPEIRKKLETMESWVTTLSAIDQWWDERDRVNYEAYFDVSRMTAVIEGDIPERVVIVEE